MKRKTRIGICLIISSLILIVTYRNNHITNELSVNNINKSISNTSILSADIISNNNISSNKSISENKKDIRIIIKDKPDDTDEISVEKKENIIRWIIWDLDNTENINKYSDIEVKAIAIDGYNYVGLVKIKAGTNINSNGIYGITTNGSLGNGEIPRLNVINVYDISVGSNIEVSNNNIISNNRINLIDNKFIRISNSELSNLYNILTSDDRIQ